ncbi:LysR family transcriptional regulator [Rheinheimera marina]|uniref:LysR family transcriptional regulator n=1 Tax=Rheinheimera marina TaxID=1774958 RepID=A0ABV9JJY3_9GAMM
MNIRHLTFRLLQVYQQVVRTGSVSAAARALHLTQPTVSLQLKKLTEELGEPLLESQGGKLVPTFAGQALYQAASDLFSRFDDLADELAEAKGGQAGRLSIGIVTTAKYVMPTILGAFDRAFPKLQVTLNVGNRAHILQRFAAQEDDLYLFSQPPSGELVQAGRIMKNPLQLIAPASHWAAHQAGPLAFSQLKNERFLMREPGSATRMQFEAWLSGQGIELTRTMQIESNEAIRLGVASGLGLAVLSSYTLSHDLQGIAQIQTQGFPLNSHWYLVARKDKRLSAPARRFIQFLATQLQHCVEPTQLVDDIRQLPAHFSLD